jgi:hypothetical protein
MTALAPYNAAAWNVLLRNEQPPRGTSIAMVAWLASDPVSDPDAMDLSREESECELHNKWVVVRGRYQSMNGIMSQAHSRNRYHRLPKKQAKCNWVEISSCFSVALVALDWIARASTHR